jgi:hypothetical protein
MMKTILFALLLSLVSTSVYSQSLNNSCNARLLVSNDSVTNNSITPGTTQWFTFNASHPNVEISAATEIGHIHSLLLLSGTCGSLDTIEYNSYTNFYNGTLRIYVSTLAVGQDYIIKVSCEQNCILCSNTTYDLSIRQFTGGSNCFKPSDCEYISNGDLELYDACPSTYPHLTSTVEASCWYSPCIIGGPLPGTPDYFNSCGVPSLSVPSNFMGSQPGRSGTGYLGIMLFNNNASAYNREYI